MIKCDDAADTGATSSVDSYVKVINNSLKVVPKNEASFFHIKEECEDGYVIAYQRDDGPSYYVNRKNILGKLEVSARGEATYYTLQDAKGGTKLKLSDWESTYCFVKIRGSKAIDHYRYLGWDSSKTDDISFQTKDKRCFFQLKKVSKSGRLMIMQIQHLPM